MDNNLNPKLRSRFASLFVLLFLSSIPHLALAQELTGKLTNCISEENPEFLCIGDECFNLCRKADGNVLTSLFYFIGNVCPNGFEKFPDMGMLIGDTDLSACKSTHLGRIAANDNNPKRVRFYLGEECPISQLWLAGTGSVSFCINADKVK